MRQRLQAAGVRSTLRVQRSVAVAGSAVARATTVRSPNRRSDGFRQCSSSWPGPGTGFGPPPAISTSPQPCSAVSVTWSGLPGWRRVIVNSGKGCAGTRPRFAPESIRLASWIPSRLVCRPSRRSPAWRVTGAPAKQNGREATASNATATITVMRFMPTPPVLSSSRKFVSLDAAGEAADFQASSQRSCMIGAVASGASSQRTFACFDKSPHHQEPQATQPDLTLPALSRTVTR